MADVLLIEPNQYLREGYCAVLHNEASCSVTAINSASSIGSCVSPDILLLGPGTIARVVSELGALRSWLADPRGTPTVLLMDVDDSATVGRVTTLGVDAILSSDVSADVLQRSLDLVLLGQQIFPPAPAEPATAPLASEPAAKAWLAAEPALTAALIALPVRRAPAAVSPVLCEQCALVHEPSSGVILSEREVQTLRGLVDGAPNKLIAQQLMVSEATVKAHVKSLLRKIRVANRTQAALWALSHPSAWTALSPARGSAANAVKENVLQFPVAITVAKDGQPPGI